jgi:hypothetical protein
MTISEADRNNVDTTITRLQTHRPHILWPTVTQICYHVLDPETPDTKPTQKLAKRILFQQKECFTTSQLATLISISKQVIANVTHG